MTTFRACTIAVVAWLAARLVSAADLPVELLRQHCYDCHSGASPEAGLDLTALSTQLEDGETFARWVKIHDRVAAGEMPPKQSSELSDGERGKFVAAVKAQLVAVETQRFDRDGRRPIRRLTRVEYENTIRDLLALDGIRLQDGLPEDGSAHNFDKTAEALDISHVNLARYMEAADAALDMAIATQPYPPQRQTHRFSLARHVYLILMNGDAVMIKDGKPDPVFPPGGHIAHVGPHEHILAVRDADKRGSSVGVFRHEDESFKPYFYDFACLYPGRYRIKTSFWSFQWDKGRVLPGRGIEAARLSVVQLQGNGRGGGHPSYILSYFDAPPDVPQEHELTSWLNFKDTLGFNTASLAPVANYSRPGRAMAFTGPGIACDYMEIEGPLHDTWPPESHRRLFGDLPLVPFDARTNPEVRPPLRKQLRQETQAPNRPDPPAGNWTVASLWPRHDARRLLASFLPRAFRGPVSDEVLQQYVGLVMQRLSEGECFESAMRYAYRAALCSPDFLYHVEHRDYYDEYALANRLSYFLWNSLPDEQLMQLAETGKLRQPKVLHEQVERMLKDPKSERFIEDFLGQWLNLRKIAANDPDRKLYPEFSPYMQDSMLAESRAYFRELLEKNLDASYLIRSNFAMLNERLAELYGVPGVEGSQIRRVPLPADCPRGAFLTQAAVLKVTANGTTTSPVPRGAFVMSRLLGQPPEPPPPNIPAVEPDVQGATTIREQLDKHRSLAVCASCHAKIDPPGFALEAFDVIGGQRTRYRSLGDGDPAPRGWIDPFIPIHFKLGPPVDSSGTLPDGRSFANVQEFQKLLVQDTRPLLENLARQLCVYATGRAIGFSERPQIATIVDRTQKAGGGVRTLVHELVASRLFLPEGPPQTAPPKLYTDKLAGVTYTRAAPPVAAPSINPAVAAEAPAEPVESAIPAQRPSVRYRLVGLSTLKRTADLHQYLQEVPEIQLVALDPELHEIELCYDLSRLFPSAPANHQPTPEQVRQQIDNRLRRASYGSFSVRPLLGEQRQALIREQLTVKLQDCKACRLCVYQTAMKLDGVEQAEVDPQTGQLTVWLRPDKKDLEPLRAALTKARVELP